VTPRIESRVTNLAPCISCSLPGSSRRDTKPAEFPHLRPCEFPISPILSLSSALVQYLQIVIWSRLSGSVQSSQETTSSFPSFHCRNERIGRAQSGHHCNKEKKRAQTAKRSQEADNSPRGKSGKEEDQTGSRHTIYLILGRIDKPKKELRACDGG
jgi:hypothetical protein